MTKWCDEIPDPTPIHVASRIDLDHDPIEAGSFGESDRIEKLWAGDKLLIQSLIGSFVESGPVTQTASNTYSEILISAKVCRTI